MIDTTHSLSVRKGTAKDVEYLRDLQRRISLAVNTRLQERIYGMDNVSVLNAIDALPTSLENSRVGLQIVLAQRPMKSLEIKRKLSEEPLTGIVSG